MSDDLTGAPAPAEPLAEHLRPTRMALWRLIKVTREALTDWPDMDYATAWEARHILRGAVDSAYRTACAGSSEGFYRHNAVHREAWPMLATALDAIMRHQVETEDREAESRWRMIAGALLPLVEADYQAIRRAST